MSPVLSLPFLCWKQQLPLIYITEKIKGTPNARNRALKNCSTKYLGFIDDDCVVDSNWFDQAIKHIKTHPINYLIGKSLLLNSNNWCAQAQFNNHQNWFNQELKKRQFSPHLFDTKNIIINMDIVRKYNLKFDAIFGNFNFSGFEDIDMGFQFAKHNLFGSYNPNLIVHHQEPEEFIKSVKKSYYRGRLKRNFNQKWQIKETCNSPSISRHLFQTLKKILTAKDKTFHNIIVVLISEINQQSFAQGYLYHPKLPQ